MIICIFGTTGEVIKLAPVLERLRQRGESPLLLCTGQHPQQIPPLLEQFGLPQPDLWLAREGQGDLERSSQVPLWMLSVAFALSKNFRYIRRQVRTSRSKSLVLVQGDTFTTVLGALMGKVLRLPIAHIEAGVRSNDWRNPFPEELNRRLTSRMANVHFAPGKEACSNLEKARGQVIDTQANTVKDSLELVPLQIDASLPSPPKDFGVVSLHRFELINDRAAFTEILDVLRGSARRVPLIFINHPITAAKIQQFGLDKMFDEKFFVRVPKFSYFGFVSLVKRSLFSVTDSGGLQQESYYLNHPCLVHRRTVETFEGLDSNVIVSQMDLQIVRGFLDDPRKFRLSHPSGEGSPSEIIVDFLLSEP